MSKRDESYEDCSSVEDTVEICFTQNRSYELPIGKETYFFSPYSSQKVPTSVLSHPDFEPVSHYFTIKR
jgi:hypothetical protein